ncbi:MAG: NAD(P)H-binding protein [Ignavibacteria bacterium]|nr:NAD(P)H-binding protein [Ignavibacteria bacterium]
MFVITGATGRVGGQTATMLLKAGKKVRAVVRHPEKAARLAELGAELAVGDMHDAAFLGTAFAGADAVLVMIPGDYLAVDFAAHQDDIGIAVTTAITSSGVKNVVNISSCGGHTEEMTGVVAGLARQEARLNALDGVNVLHLRPTYFMENTMGSIGMIKSMGIMGSAIAADKPMALIAVKDIAQIAFEKMVTFTTRGKVVLPLLGPKHYTMAEFTAVLGAAIGKPELPYVQFPPADTIGAMMGMGLSESAARGMVTLMEGINAGVFDHETRDADSSTPTTAEEFATMFAQVFQVFQA